ncbi:MAG TPA: hypothetical protein ENI55_00815 [Alphaproteobacteria bacterium]|nr:hypothetical protein [Alphaproteobacteria bacterium]
MIPITDQIQAPALPNTRQMAEEPGFQPFGKDGFTFGDFIDIINPLQHIPIVSTVYRQLTGDDLDPGSRIGGGALFGGPIGLVASLINVMVDETTGKDIGEQVLALFSGGAPTKTAELTNQTKKTVWTNPDATAPAPSLATATADEVGGGGKETAAASPVREGIDVLVWARRETAFRRRVQATDAAIGDSDIARRVAAMQTNETQVAALAGSLNPSPGNRKTVAGAVAPLGGWFSDTMLSALNKYQAASALNTNGSGRRAAE